MDRWGGVLGIDSDWNVVFPWSYSVDTRYNKYLFKIEEEMGSKIRRSSGGPPATAAKILWIKDSFPEKFAKIHKFINLTTYVAGKICNLKAEDAFIDYSCLSMSGLADVKKAKWNSSICKKLGVDIKRLLKILKPFECIGYIDKKKFDTEKDIKVLVGCGDKVAGFLGAGVINNNDLVDDAGTYTVLGYCTDKFKGDSKNKIVYSIYSGISSIYYQMALVAAGGYTYNWFIDKFDYSDKKLLKKSEDSKGLYFIPHIGGRFSPSQSYFEGSWLGIKWEHDLDSFYISLLESIGYEFNYVLNFIKDFNDLKRYDFSEIKVIGGGSKNMYWNRIKSNILDLKYIKMNELPFEIIGAFLIAKYKDDLRDGYNDLVRNNIVFIENIIYPEKERVELYKKYKENYIEIINRLEEIYYKLSID